MSKLTETNATKSCQNITIIDDFGQVGPHAQKMAKGSDLWQTLVWMLMLALSIMP